MSTSSHVRSTLAAAAALTLASSLGLAVSTGPVSLAAGTISLQPRTSTPPATTLAIIRTIGVGDAPGPVAVNDADDTVYVANATGRSLTAIDGGTGSASATAPLVSGAAPSGIAVDQLDDTVYVTAQAPASLIALNGSNIDDSRAAAVPASTVPPQPTGVAVYESADFVFVANGNALELFTSALAPPTDLPVSAAKQVAINQDDDTIYVTSSPGLWVNGIFAGGPTLLGGFSEPEAVAVNQDDDTVYVVNTFGAGANSLTVVNGRNTDDSVTIPVGSDPSGVAVDQQSDLVYVANFSSNSVSVINGRNLDDSLVIGVGGQPRGVAVDGAGSNQGLVYVANSRDDFVSVIGYVTPSVSPTFGAAADTVTIGVNVPQVTYDVDPATVASVSFGGVAATGLNAGAGDTWTVTAPAGTGTVPVTVTFAGGLTASAGTFTYGSPPGPTPDPTYPPSAPLNVTAVPGDGQATVSWTAPASSGSFAVTDYQALITPGGHSCLVTTPTLSCTITGLTNGTTYTANVRALNGAGWGTYSTPTAPFTPVAPINPTITITGTRAEIRERPGIRITGQSTGFTPDTTLRPWHRFPGQTGYTEGVATINPNDDGDFTWQRRTGKTITVIIRSMDGTVESNRLTLRVG